MISSYISQRAFHVRKAGWLSLILVSVLIPDMRNFAQISHPLKIIITSWGSWGSRIGPVCVCVCVRSLTTEPFDIRARNFTRTSIWTISRTTSKMKVIGQRSRSRGQKTWSPGFRLETSMYIQYGVTSWCLLCVYLSQSIKAKLSIVNVNLLFSFSKKEIYVTCTGWFEFWPKLHWMLIQVYQGEIKAVLACNVILSIIRTSQYM